MFIFGKFWIFICRFVLSGLINLSFYMKGKLDRRILANTLNDLYTFNTAFLRDCKIALSLLEEGIVFGLHGFFILLIYEF